MDVIFDCNCNRLCFIILTMFIVCNMSGVTYSTSTRQKPVVTFFLVVCCSAVSPYDPESLFISNVLSRLEAVMGIQIVSALASIHSQLTTTSGVQLHGFPPDPDIYPDQYVKKVISQWSEGHSLRPRTWRHLLEVLRDIGLLELSQQIEMFMKGKGKSVCVDYIFMYNSYICCSVSVRSQLSCKLKQLLCLFLYHSFTYILIQNTGTLFGCLYHLSNI